MTTRTIRRWEVWAVDDSRRLFGVALVTFGLLLLVTTIVSMLILTEVREIRAEEEWQSRCLDVVAQNLAPDPQGGTPAGCPVSLGGN